MSDRCTMTYFGHKKEAMGGQQQGMGTEERTRERGGGDNQKHSTVNINDTTYNSIENKYVFSNLARAPTTKKTQETKE